ncbi:unnamed protein product [Cuscuta campestris]|uniref:Cytochrome b5 heme-binding domain-containing protein n=1 Tax=Cuscuta campestris TaxID=132261 RepID=A0A484L7H1_9ASTE|nr:unnamed protein product [Cuscuta campestris]
MFGKTTGLHIIHQKSQMMLGGLDDKNKDELTMMINMPKGGLRFRYLEAPISASRINIRDCDELVQKNHLKDQRMFYGPGGAYAMFAGKDASRALAKLSFDPREINGNLEGLCDSELETLLDWECKFMEKYAKVGQLVPP